MGSSQMGSEDDSLTIKQQAQSRTAQSKTADQATEVEERRRHQLAVEVDRILRLTNGTLDWDRVLCLEKHFSQLDLCSEMFCYLLFYISRSIESMLG